MWFAGVLYLGLLVNVRPFKAAWTKPNVDQWTWKYDCIEGRCIRSKEKSSGALGDSLEACRISCGPFGALWPKPVGRLRFTNRAVVATHPSKFKFELDAIAGGSEPISHVREMTKLLVDNLHKDCGGNCTMPSSATPAVVTTPAGDAGSATPSPVNVVVHLKTESPNLILNSNTNESYSFHLETTSSGSIAVEISAQTVYGLRHGLEVLCQVTIGVPVAESAILIILSGVRIERDAPAYVHRGLLLDTSRHFLPLSFIKTQVDGLAAAKMNVLHWHATDSHSWPLEIPGVRNMTLYGAYSGREVYTPDDVQELVAYARLRGVRIVMEIDSPAHAGFGWQWGEAAGLGKLSACVGQEPWTAYCVQPPCGQMNPTNPHLFAVLTSIYRYVQEALPDLDMIHMGGDEVHLPCWNATPEIGAWLKAQGRGRSTDDLMWLWGEFHRLATQAWDDAARALGRKPVPVVLWSSHLTDPAVIDNYLDKDRYIIEPWTDTWEDTPLVLLNKGYKVIMATKDAWYLDHGFWGRTTYHTWKNAYDNRIPEASRGVYGGEACMWSELVDASTIMTRIWPRASAVGERLWSDPITDSNSAEYRLLTHREKLVKRGIASETLTPQWCYQNEGLCIM